MILRREVPHFRVCTKDDVAYGLPFDVYEQFMNAWQAGETFWTGEDLWGQGITIKLFTIVCVICKTSASIELCRAEDEEERQRALINGDPPS